MDGGGDSNGNNDNIDIQFDFIPGLPRKVTPDMVNSGRKAWTFILMAEICILLGIFSFGANKTLIRSSTAVLKVDTRKATVNDILGGIELLPIESSTSTTSSSRPTAITTSTYSTRSSIPTSSYLNAKYSLENITELLTEIDSYVTVKDFSLARVFSIHDHLYLANAGFRCWSDHTSRDDLSVVSASLNNCPSNGFTKCFGKSSATSMYSSSAYLSINTDYLTTSTSLNESYIDDISTMWYYVLNGANSSTVRLNLDHRAYNSISRLLCGNDYIYSDVRGSSQDKASKTVIFGIVGLIFAVLIVVFSIFSIIAAFTCWFISFTMIITMFALSFNSNIPASKYINKSEGITAKSAQGGLVAYFVVIMVFMLDVLMVFLRGFNTRRRLQAYKAEEERLSNIYTSANGNQTNPEEIKSGFQ